MSNDVPVVPFCGCRFLLMIIPSSPLTSFFKRSILNRLLVRLGKLFALLLLSEFKEVGPEPVVLLASLFDSFSPFFLNLRLGPGLEPATAASRLFTALLLLFWVCCCCVFLESSGNLLFLGGFLIIGSFFLFLYQRIFH